MEPSFLKYNFLLS